MIETRKHLATRRLALDPARQLRMGLANEEEIGWEMRVNRISRDFVVGMAVRFRTSTSLCPPHEGRR